MWSFDEELDHLFELGLGQYSFKRAICNHEWTVKVDEYGTFHHCPKCHTVIEH